MCGSFLFLSSIVVPVDGSCMFCRVLQGPMTRETHAVGRSLSLPKMLPTHTQKEAQQCWLSISFLSSSSYKVER